MWHLLTKYSVGKMIGKEICNYREHTVLAFTLVKIWKFNLTIIVTLQKIAKMHCRLKSRLILAWILRICNQNLHILHINRILPEWCKCTAISRMSLSHFLWQRSHKNDEAIKATGSIGLKLNDFLFFCLSRVDWGTGRSYRLKIWHACGTRCYYEQHKRSKRYFH